MPPGIEKRTTLAVAVLTGAALAIAALPSLSLAGDGPRLAITAEARTSPRDALLEGVAKPLERRLASLPGVRRVETRVEDGRVEIRVSGARGTDPDAFHLAALRRTDGLALPLDRLTVALLPEREPALELALLGGGSAARRSVFARVVLLPEIARSRGAGRIEIAGARPLHVAVAPQAAALAAHGLTPLDVVDRLRTVGVALPAGRVRDGAAVRPLALRERIDALARLGALEIQGPAGATPLSEVALLRPREIEDGSWLRFRGEDGVLLRVFRAPGGDPARLAREVERALARLQPTARSAGMRIAVLPARGRPFLSARLRFLFGALLVGALLVAALAASVLGFGLRRWRAAWAALAAAALLAAGTGIAAARPRELDAADHRLTLRFDLPGSPTPESLRRRGESLARDLVRQVADLHPEPSFLLYRGDERLARIGSPGTGGGSDLGDLVAGSDPDPDGERGRFEIAFPSSASARQARVRLEKALARIPDLLARIEGAPAFALEASAPSEAQAEALGQRLAQALEGRLGRRPQPDSALRARTGLRLSWDDSLLLSLGADEGALAEQVRAGLGGFGAGRVEIAGVEPELWVEPTAADDLGLLPLRPQAGTAAAVPLRALARIERRPEAAPLLRVDGRPTLRLHPLAGAGLDRRALKKILSAVRLGPGERLVVSASGEGGA